jgi:hypothetical protein
VVVGLILLLMGVVFALQGAGDIGGSSVMTGNSIYIYIGGAVALVGIVVLVLGFRSGRSTMRSESQTAVN